MCSIIKGAECTQYCTADPMHLKFLNMQKLDFFIIHNANTRFFHDVTYLLSRVMYIF